MAVVSTDATLSISVKKPENTNLRGSITVRLTSCLFCLDSAALLMLSYLATAFLVRSNQNQSNWRSVVDWYFPLVSLWRNLLEDVNVFGLYLYRVIPYPGLHSDTFTSSGKLGAGSLMGILLAILLWYLGTLALAFYYSNQVPPPLQPRQVLMVSIIQMRGESLLI